MLLRGRKRRKINVSGSFFAIDQVSTGEYRPAQGRSLYLSLTVSNAMLPQQSTGLPVNTESTLIEMHGKDRACPATLSQ